MSIMQKTFKCDCGGSACDASVDIAAYVTSHNHINISYTIHSSGGDDDGSFCSIKYTRNSLKQMIKYLQQIEQKLIDTSRLTGGTN